MWANHQLFSWGLLQFLYRILVLNQDINKPFPAFVGGNGVHKIWTFFPNGQEVPKVEKSLPPLSLAARLHALSLHTVDTLWTLAAVMIQT